MNTEVGVTFSSPFSSGSLPVSSVSGGSAHQLPPPSLDSQVDTVHLLSSVFPAFWRFQTTINDLVQRSILVAVVVRLGVCVEVGNVRMQICI